MKNLNFELAIPAITLVITLLVISTLYPEQSQLLTSNAMHFVTGWFGWLVELVSLALVGFLFWLAFSKYGSIRLGEEKKEHSNFFVRRYDFYRRCRCFSYILGNW